MTDKEKAQIAAALLGVGLVYQGWRIHKLNKTWETCRTSMLGLATKLQAEVTNIQFDDIVKHMDGDEK